MTAQGDEMKKIGIMCFMVLATPAAVLAESVVEAVISMNTVICDSVKGVRETMTVATFKLDFLPDRCAYSVTSGTLYSKIILKDRIHGVGTPVIILELLPTQENGLPRYVFAAEKQ